MRIKVPVDVPWEIWTSKCIIQHWQQKWWSQGRLWNLSGKEGIVQTGQVIWAPKLRPGSGWIGGLILDEINKRLVSLLYSFIMVLVFHSWVWSRIFAKEGVIWNTSFILIQKCLLDWITVNVILKEHSNLYFKEPDILVSFF